MPIGRYSPDTFTLIDPGNFYPQVDIMIGSTAYKESVYRVALNQNMVHRNVQKCYVHQDLSSDASQDYIETIPTAAPGAPDPQMVWYLDHLPCDGELAHKVTLKTTDGGSGSAVGLRATVKDAGGNVTTVFDVRPDTAGDWCSFTAVSSGLASSVADTTIPHLLILSTYQVDPGATLYLRTIDVLGEALASTALGSGIRASGYIPQAIEQWDADSPLATANMQALTSNLQAFLADKNSTFANFADWIEEAGDHCYLAYTLSALYYPMIGPIAVRYMPDVSALHYAICAYAETTGDRMRIYTGHELGTLKDSGLTSFHPSYTLAGIDPTDFTHWHTGTIVVREKQQVMQDDFIHLDYLTPAGRNVGIIGLAVWE